MKFLAELLITRQKTADEFVLKQMTHPVVESFWNCLSSIKTEMQGEHIFDTSTWTQYISLPLISCWYPWIGLSNISKTAQPKKIKAFTNLALAIEVKSFTSMNKHIWQREVFDFLTRYFWIRSSSLLSNYFWLLLTISRLYIYLNRLRKQKTKENMKANSRLHVSYISYYICIHVGAQRYQSKNLFCS